ncbi:MAG: membrane-bound lytic murein transglycosylase MltF [Zoogloeaceae bacterium]|nr:membrane-bound lytic murein transglycosylase MltF [Zoogloeaceae bacterium]
MRSWLLALGALFLVACSPAPTAPARLGDYRSAGELRVATRVDPLSYREDPDGKGGGFERDLLVALAQRLGVPIQFKTYPDALGALDAVVRGDAHLAAAGLTHNGNLPVRWSRSLRDVDYVIAGRDDGADLTNERDLAGHTVGVRRGSAAADALDAIQRRGTPLKPRHPKAGGDQGLLELVAKGSLEFAATDEVQFALAANYFPSLHIALPLAAKSSIRWAFPDDGAGDLPEQVDAFLAAAHKEGSIARIGDRYFGHIRRLDEDDITNFLARIERRLPAYRRHFHDAQAVTGIDWRLLAALAYQESQWDPLATSPTGVRGIMMLTEDTADRLGVDNRLDARAAILGGGRYFAMLRDQIPDEVPEPDRSWMAIAAYNLGMGHFNAARQIARGLKRDLTAWLDIKQVLPLLSKPAYAARLKSGPARGGEAVVTAENVRNYFQILSHYEPPYVPPLDAAPIKLPPLRLGSRPKRPTETAMADPPRPSLGLHVPADAGPLDQDSGRSTSSPPM